jgi:U3 small nucleolar RNA-associated protein 7
LDVSTGQQVSQIKTKVKNATSMKKNPFNASISVSSDRGFVSLYVPSVSEPVVKMNCHNASIRDHAYSSCGKYLVTAASDSLVKIWDLRNSYKSLGEYFTRNQPSYVDISQKDVLAISSKNNISFLRNWENPNTNEPYLRHQDKKRRVISGISFVPYEDYLGVGLEGGFSSIMVPGSCKVQYDTFIDNVSGNKKQKRENAVHKILEKLPMESIVLNPHQIGKVDPNGRAIIEQEQLELKKQIELNKIKNQKRKKRSKMNAEKFKEMKRNQEIRMRMRDEKETRDILRQTETLKEQEELDLLDNSVPNILKMGKQTSIWNRLITRCQDTEQAQTN